MCNSSSLLRCLMMYYCVSHRCLTIVMQRMFCQRSTLHVGNSCYIMLHPRSDGAPQKCQWMPLCSVALSPHVLSLAKYLTRAFEKIPKIPIPPTANTFILPQLCAHGAFKITKQLVTEFVLSLSLHQIIPLLHPLSSPPAGSGAPGLCRPQHRRRHPLRGAAPPRRRGQWQPRGAAVSNLRRRRARRRQRLAPPRGSPPPTPTAVGETAICGVKSVSFIFFKIV